MHFLRAHETTKTRIASVAQQADERSIGLMNLEGRLYASRRQQKARALHTMTQIRVNTGSIRAATSALAGKAYLLQSVSAVVTRAVAVASPACFLVRGMDDTLRTCASNVREIENDCMRLQRGVAQMMSNYEQAEQTTAERFRVTNRASGAGVHSAGKSGGGAIGSAATGAAVAGAVSSVTSSAFGHKEKGSSSATIDENGIKAKASGKAEGWLLKSEVKQQVGDATLESETELLDVYAKGEAFAKFSGDDIGVGLMGAVGGSLLQTTVKGQLGSDDYNVHAAATGKVMTAEAKAEGYVGTDGLKAKASAEVCAVKGEVKTGITIMGVKIDATVEGKAGALGGEAGIEATSEGVSANVGASALLGIELKVNVDWSDAKLPSYNDIKKWLF